MVVLSALLIATSSAIADPSAAGVIVFVRGEVDGARAEETRRYEIVCGRDGVGVVDADAGAGGTLARVAGRVGRAPSSLTQTWRDRLVPAALRDTGTFLAQDVLASLHLDCGEVGSSSDLPVSVDLPGIGVVRLGVRMVCVAGTQDADLGYAQLEATGVRVENGTVFTVDIRRRIEVRRSPVGDGAIRYGGNYAVSVCHSNDCSWFEADWFFGGRATPPRCP